MLLGRNVSRLRIDMLSSKLRSTDQCFEIDKRIVGTGRCGGGRYGGGHYGGGRYGGAFQFRVDATAEPSDTHITMDATAGWG